MTGFTPILETLGEASRALYPSPRSERLSHAHARIAHLLAALDAYKACREATPATFADSMSLCLGGQLAWNRVQDAVAELRGAA